MGSEVLASMIMTSIAPVLPGIFFLLLVEPVDSMKSYRFKLINRNDMIEEFNNAVTVGMFGYAFFIITVPLMNWFSSVMLDITVTQAVTSMGLWIQATLLTLLTMLNITLAYLSLEK